MTMFKFGLVFAILVVALSNAKPFDNEESKNFEIIRLIPKPTKKLISEEDLKNLVELFQRTSKANDEIIVNDYIDEMLVKLNKEIVNSGLDPVQLEDEGFEWEFKWLLITYSAEMSLKSGWMQGLATLGRVKDCTLNSDGETMTLVLPLTFTDLLFSYEYKAKLMGLGPSGGVDGKIRDSKFTITVKIDVVTLQAEIESYKLNKAGKLSVKFSGNILYDWMLNMFASVTVTFLTPIFKIFVSGWVYDLVNMVLVVYNQYVCDMLGNCF